MGRFKIFLIFLLAVLGAGAAFLYHREFMEGRQIGLASWYGKENGKETASGETFNPDLLTAAHRKLPFNTIVRVTNRENGRTVDVRINDRGPYSGQRILDLSPAAADQLQMKEAGVVMVDLEVVSYAKKKSP